MAVSEEAEEVDTEATAQASHLTAMRLGRTARLFTAAGPLTRTVLLEVATAIRPSDG